MNTNSERIIELFGQAMAIASAEERERFLAEACRNEPEVRAQIDSLIEAAQHPHDFLNTPSAHTRGTVILPVTEKAGDIIGRYKLLQQIGEGGCGVVYMAEQSEPVKRRVALKVIKLGMDTKQVVARFEAERQALALMDHPHIAKVLDAGATGTGRPYFVMELVRGTKITEFCDQQKLSTEERLDLFLQVCSAIQHAHQKGIIHRDIKPSNILVTINDGVPVPKVIDFGIAKATSGQELTDKTLFTAFEQFIGTPAYMSPEQAVMTSLDIDTRSDIYSLGVLLYELLTGRTPFDAQELLRSGVDGIRKTLRDQEPVKPSTKLNTLPGADLSTVANARHSDAPKLLHSIRGDLDWIVMKCLEKDRARRYETANGLAADLKRHLGNEPIIARPPSVGYLLQKAYRRNKLVVAVAGAVSLALLIGIVASTWQAIRAKRAERAAEVETQRAVAAEKNARDEAVRATEAKQSAKTQAERAIKAEALAQRRLTESEEARVEAEAISGFMVNMFQSSRPEGIGGRELKVVDVLDKAAANLESGLTSQPDRRARLQATIADTYASLSLNREAITLAEKVRDYYLATRGSEHADTLTAMLKLANYHRGAGDLDESIKLYEQVIELRRQALGLEHPDTLRTMTDLAAFCERNGRREKALKVREELVVRHENVTARSRQTHGPEHPNTLRAMENLMYAYAKAGRKDESLKLGEELLAQRRRVNGPEHPETLDLMGKLSQSYRYSDRKDDALKLGLELLTLRRKVNGPEHPATIREIGNLSGIYRSLGREDEANKWSEEALALRSKGVSTDDSVETIEAIRSRANNSWNAGRKDEAIKLLEEGLELRRKRFGREHRQTLVDMSILATRYAENNRAEEALKIREELLALQRKVNGPEHRGLLLLMETLVKSYLDAGRKDDALKMQEDVLALRCNVEGPEHPNTLSAMGKLAVSYDAAGRKDEAVKMRAELAALKPASPIKPPAAPPHTKGSTKGELPELAKQSADNPSDKPLAIRVSALQAWFGMNAEQAETCRRMLAWAAEKDDVKIGGGVPMLTCLRPIEDAGMRQAALEVARKVALASEGKSPWYKMTLGMAQYRNGMFTEAEDSLRATLKITSATPQMNKVGVLEGITNLYLAMSLFQQGKTDEARALFTATEAKMKPLPADEANPLAEKGTDHDHLVLWLAYKEAKALLAGAEPGK